MADNILKNEFMWEKKQEKKKLYKNWKLYAIALGITVIGTGTGLGVYYGVYGNHSEVTKIDLSTLNQNAIDATSLNMSKEEAFNAFKENNKDKDLDFNKFDVTITKQPGYGSDNGLFTITAKTNTKYSGTITISIKANKQDQLSSVLTVKEIDAVSSADETISAVLAANHNPEALSASDLKAENFEAPNYGQTGSVIIIVSNTKSKFTGSVDVSIKSSNGYDKELTASSKNIRENPNNNINWSRFFNYAQKLYINKTTISLTMEELNILKSNKIEDEYPIVEKLLNDAQNETKKLEIQYGIDKLFEQYIVNVDINNDDKTPSDGLVAVYEKEKKLWVWSSIVLTMKNGIKIKLSGINLISYQVTN